MRRVRVRALLLLVAMLFVTHLADAQINLNTTVATRQAKATPDECWAGIGHNQAFVPYPVCLLTVPNSIPKVNQAYIWAMTSFGDDIWFGTIANPQCITEAGLFPPESLVPYQTATWACEFDKSPYVPAFLPGIIGDFRPPQVLAYNKTTHALTDLTPKVPVTPGNPTGIDPAFLTTRGIRAAVTIGNVILFAGPSLVSGLNFFAYRADTKQYLGSGVVPGFDNIRQMLVVNGVLYIPVGSNNLGGTVLRWRGTVTANPCTSCFVFETVGNLDGIGAYITLHQGRLFVSTWPTGAPTSVSSLMMSPVVPAAGLTAADAPSWRHVWDATQYEPDRVVAASYAGGALASFGGYLYWGTMHVPWLATTLALGAYPPPTTDEGWIELLTGTFRSISIFRARTFDTAAPDIQLLYGLPALPAFKSATSTQPAHWEYVPNNMPSATRDPLYGLAGFGNPYNNYTWAMTVWDNRLWVGTMDWSELASEGTQTIYNAIGVPVPVEISTFFSFQNFGSDLYFFQDTVSSAVPENNTGVGNSLSYGVRNMLPNGNLFLGMANGANLATGLGPNGGWELIELSKKSGSTPLTLLTGLSCTPLSLAGAGTVQCTATVNRPATNTNVTVGVVPLLFDATPTASVTVTIPSGLTSVTFPVQVTETTKPARLYVLAGLNGGSIVTGVDVTPGVPRISGATVGQGTQSGNIFWIDLKLTNSGTGAAQQVNLTQFALRTLTGTGTVTVATGAGLTPALPIAVGAIPVGDSRTIRLFLNVPSTVSRFSITESGSLANLGGITYTMSIGQSIFK